MKKRTLALILAALLMLTGCAFEMGDDTSSAMSAVSIGGSFASKC